MPQKKNNIFSQSTMSQSEGKGQNQMDTTKTVDIEKMSTRELKILLEGRGVKIPAGPEKAELVAWALASEVWSQQGLTLCTYNVEFYHAKQGCKGEEGTPEGKVMSALLESKADVCVLQETHEGWNVLFKNHAELKTRYPHSFDTGSQHGCGGISVLSSAPLTGMRLVDPSRSVKGSYFPALYFEREGVRFIVVHLRPPVNDDGSAGRSTMGDTSPIRKAELQYIFNALRGEQPLDRWLAVAPLIVVGDFNEDDEHQAVCFCKENGMNDALMLTGQHTHWWPLWKVKLVGELEEQGSIPALIQTTMLDSTHRYENDFAQAD